MTERTANKLLKTITSGSPLEMPSYNLCTRTTYSSLFTFQRERIENVTKKLVQQDICWFSHGYKTELSVGGYYVTGQESENNAAVTASDRNQ